MQVMPLVTDYCHNLLNVCAEAQKRSSAANTLCRSGANTLCRSGRCQTFVLLS